MDITPKILIVDDDNENLHTLESCLSVLDIDVVIASKEQEVLAKITENEFVLFILNMLMLEVNGFKLANTIRSNMEIQKTPIILISKVKPDDTQIFQKYESGAVDYIHSPFNTELLQNKVQFFLGLYIRNKELETINNQLKKDLEKCQMAEAQLKTLAKFPDENPNPVLRINQDLTILYANKASKELLGIWQAQVGKHLPDTWSSKINQCLKTGRHSTLDINVTGRAFRFLIMPISDGQTVNLYATEIIEKDKYLEQFQLLTQVFENTIEGIIITDVDGSILKVNSGFTRITGYNSEDAIDQNPRILKSDRHSQQFYKEMWDSLIKNDQWKGEIWNRRKDGETYPEYLSIIAIKNQKGFTTNYVAAFHDLSPIKRSEEQLKYQVNHDALTELPNRQLANDRLEISLAQAKRRNQMVALILLDLDDFKKINDSLGHYYGDLALIEAAKRIKDCCRSEDTVARFGGDEFMVIVQGIIESHNIVNLTARIIDEFAHPFTLNGHEFYITPSMGITCYPADGNDVQTLVKNADIAMYKAKKQNHSKYSMFTKSMNDTIIRRIELESSLRDALKNNDFDVYYQPKVNSKTCIVTGTEALVRWQRSKNEIVSPDEFISVAEETGLILPLGEYVLYTACRQTKAWQDAGFGTFTVAVNLSALQFQNHDLLSMVSRILAETGLSPTELNLEITENIAMIDVEATVNILHQLSAMGIKISLDDFGTGYSSLSYLKRFAIDVLKIDKSFVDGLPDDKDDIAISRLIILLAKSLDLEIVAEGVETKEQLEFMRNHECDKIQGYLFSKPLPANELTKLLHGGKKLTIN